MTADGQVSTDPVPSETTPNLVDSTLQSRLHGLTLETRRRLEGTVTGRHRSRLRGFSAEFAEHREYTPGVDPRHIDWKVFGRSDRFYIKEFEEETNLRANIFLDQSESMA